MNPRTFIAARSTAALALLGGVLILGAALRLVGITRVGIHNADEAMYARHARFYARQAWLGAADVGVGSKEAERAEISRIKSSARRVVKSWNDASDDFYNKPTFGHAYLGAAAMLLTGAEDWGTALVSAVFGIGAISISFLIAERLFGTRAALFAAAFLAVSRYWLYYSRSGYAETDSVFFLMTGLLLRIQASKPAASRDAKLAWSAFFFGMGTVCHYRWLALFPALLALEYASGLRTERRGIKSVLLALAFYASPILLMEVPSYFMMLTATLAETPLLHIHSYLTNLIEVYLKSHQGGINVSALAVYPAYFALNDGPLAFAAALTGLAVCVRKPDSERRLVLYFLAASLLLLIGQSYHVERAWSCAIPCLAVLAGGGVDWLLSKAAVGGRWKSAPIFAAALLLGLGLARCLPIIDSPAGAKAVSQFLLKKRRAAVVVPAVEMGETAYNYYGAGQTFVPTASIEEARALGRRGDHWLIFDPTPFDATRPSYLDDWLEIRTKLLEEGPPAFSAPHGRGTWMNRCFNGQNKFPELWRRWRKYRHDPPESIEIFDLRAS